MPIRRSKITLSLCFLWMLCALAQPLRAEATAQGAYDAGIQLEKQGAYDQAIGQFRLCLSMERGRVEAFREIGNCLHTLGRDREALRALNRYLKGAPDDTTARELADSISAGLGVGGQAATPSSGRRVRIPEGQAMTEPEPQPQGGEAEPAPEPQAGGDVEIGGVLPLFPFRHLYWAPRFRVGGPAYVRVRDREPYVYPLKASLFLSGSIAGISQSNASTGNYLDQGSNDWSGPDYVDAAFGSAELGYLFRGGFELLGGYRYGPQVSNSATLDGTLNLSEKLNFRESFAYLGLGYRMPLAKRHGLAFAFLVGPDFLNGDYSAQGTTMDNSGNLVGSNGGYDLNAGTMAADFRMTYEFLPLSHLGLDFTVGYHSAYFPLVTAGNGNGSYAGVSGTQTNADGSNVTFDTSGGYAQFGATLYFNGLL
jgi:hypothetical protein